jgi:tetratricopeptide (TPR) repeat protein
LIAFEADTKQKYTALAEVSLRELSGTLVNNAIKDNEEKKFKDAADKLYMSYNLNKKDTVYLYYAANSAVNGKLYEDALKYYNELKDLNYDGREKQYYAKHIESGEVHKMESQSHQNLMVKSKQYTEPTEKFTESRRSEIVKNIALIYTELDQKDKALQAYADARVSNPNDVNLILNEANLYLTQGNKAKFKELMAEATKIAPENPDLHYNIGVISAEQKDFEAAKKAYRKTLEINPGYVNALLNLSSVFLDEGNALIDEMNKLGNSRKDIARYDELKIEKDEFFKKGAQILEDGLKLNAGNQSILESLKNIYGALGDTDNFTRIKGMIKG